MTACTRLPNVQCNKSVYDSMSTYIHMCVYMNINYEV